MSCVAKGMAAMAVAATFACSGAAVGPAAANLAIGVAAAGVSRARGGCYAACPVGTACDARSGLCEELPCRGTCASDEVCDARGVIQRCVPAVPAVDMRVHRKADQAPSSAPPGTN